MSLVKVRIISWDLERPHEINVTGSLAITHDFHSR
jgi:hypothetical protein